MTATINVKTSTYHQHGVSEPPDSRMSPAPAEESKHVGGGRSGEEERRSDGGGGSSGSAQEDTLFKDRKYNMTHTISVLNGPTTVVATVDS